MPSIKRPINTVRAGRLLVEKTHTTVIIWEQLLTENTRPVIVHLEELAPLVEALTDLMETCTPNELDPTLSEAGN